MPYRFFIADVFTDRAFGGNQLAVLPEAQGLSDAEMQALAREFNFSETTFVLPPTKPGHTHRVRIFTPGAELPFAGHPNIGTAVVLASLAGDGQRAFRFQEGVGTVSIEATVKAGTGFAKLTLDTTPEIRPLELTDDQIASMLSLSAGQIGPLKPWSASTGGPHICCIPLTSRDAVAHARFDTAVWERLLPAGSRARDVYAIAGDFAPGGRIKVRLWAPSHGIAEDPATGSAAGTLAASLAQTLPDPSGRFAWTIEQGAEIGRPSLIEAEAEKEDGAVVRIRVGGSAVIVAEGTLSLP